MSTFAPFCAVLRIDAQYLLAHRVENILGWNADEAWFFGTVETPEARQLRDAIHAALIPKRGTLHWTPQFPSCAETQRAHHPNPTSPDENLPRR